MCPVCARHAPTGAPTAKVALALVSCPVLRPNEFGDERRVVELATVGQHVRVGVRRDAELPLPHEPADLGPGASLSVEKGDPAVPKVMW